MRLAGIEDAATIARVLLLSFSEYRPSYTASAFAATTPSATAVVARLSEGPIWLAQSEDAVIGTVSAVLRGDSVYIRGMGVLPNARGQQIGFALLERVELFARELSRPRLFLSTTPFLDRAIRLYERSGFRRIDDGPHDLFGTPLFTMEKWLV
jgi:GNAT superfamily N-acetyltransferase